MPTRIIAIFLLLILQLAYSNAISLSPGEQAKVQNGIDTVQELADDLQERFADKIKLLTATQPRPLTKRQTMNLKILSKSTKLLGKQISI